MSAFTQAGKAANRRESGNASGAHAPGCFGFAGLSPARPATTNDASWRHDVSPGFASGLAALDSEVPWLCPREK